MEDQHKNYINPYLAGIGLGLVLLLTFVLMGRGLGASGAFTSVLAAAADMVAPIYAQGNALINDYLNTSEKSPLYDWLVFEVVGIFIGGYLSGFFAKRNKFMIEKGPRVKNLSRLILAFTGGCIMGFAAKLARGCTSGQALSGGAVMSVGSWIFMLAVFAGAYAFAYFVRRQWL